MRNEQEIPIQKQTILKNDEMRDIKEKLKNLETMQSKEISKLITRENYLEYCNLVAKYKISKQQHESSKKLKKSTTKSEIIDLETPIKQPKQLNNSIENEKIAAVGDIKTPISEPEGAAMNFGVVDQKINELTTSLKTAMDSYKRNALILRGVETALSTAFIFTGLGMLISAVAAILLLFLAPPAVVPVLITATSLTVIFGVLAVATDVANQMANNRVANNNSLANAEKEIYANVTAATKSNQIDPPFKDKTKIPRSQSLPIITSKQNSQDNVPNEGSGDVDVPSNQTKQLEKRKSTPKL